MEIACVLFTMDDLQNVSTVFSTKLPLLEEPSLQDYFKTTNTQEFYTELILEFSEHLVSHISLVLKPIISPLLKAIV